MALPIPNVELKIADLQEGESIIRVNARAGDEYSSPEIMAIKIGAQLALNGVLRLKDLETEVLKIQYRRCGWIERPAPDDQPGIHDAPVGQLWIVYKRTEPTNERMPAQTA